MKRGSFFTLIVIVAMLVLAIGLADALVIAARPFTPWFAWMLP